MDWEDKITPSFGSSLRGMNAVCGQTLLIVYNLAYSNFSILSIELFNLQLWHCTLLRASPSAKSTDRRGHTYTDLCWGSVNMFPLNANLLNALFLFLVSAMTHCLLAEAGIVVFKMICKKQANTCWNAAK